MRMAFVVDKVEFSVPLGIAYLAAALKARGHEAAVFQVEPGSNRSINALRVYQPDIVGYSVISGRQGRYLEINLALKERMSFYSVFGGAHPTFIPEIISREGVDAVCRGEGEEALVEFVEFIAKYRELPDNIANFWVKKKGAIYKNHPRPLKDDLDELPYPDRMMFLDKFPRMKVFRRAEFLAHRGCPYGCAYCFNIEYNNLYRNKGRIYRSRDPELLCEEISKFRDAYDFRFIHFVDDVFTLDLKWLRGFSAVYSREIKVPFSVNMRLDNCSTEAVSLLKEAGCYLVHVGIESGNESIRREIMRRNMSDDTICQGFRILQKAGIKILSENILGVPGEGYKPSLETLKMNALLKPDFANASLFTPYPGLGLTNYATQKGYFSKGFDSLGAGYYNASVLEFSEKMDLNRILNLRCFFSFLCRHKAFLPFFNLISRIRYNKLFKNFGSLLDGYYLHKLLPWRPGIMDLLALCRIYITSYRI